MAPQMRLPPFQLGSSRARSASRCPLRVSESPSLPQTMTSEVSHVWEFISKRTESFTVSHRGNLTSDLSSSQYTQTQCREKKQDNVAKKQNQTSTDCIYKKDQGNKLASSRAECYVLYEQDHRGTDVGAWQYK